MTKRVLLAEDEPNIVESLTFLLDRAGFEVAVETDGQQALDTALNDTPDLLILDVMLPKMSGYEVLRLLRADRRAEALAILQRWQWDGDLRADCRDRAGQLVREFRRLPV